MTSAQAPESAVLRHALARATGRADRDVAAFAEIDSTSSELKRRLAGGTAGPGSLVVAAAQSAGRGRLGRSWVSPPSGNLYASLAVTVEGPAEERVPLVPLAAGVAAVDALERCGKPGVVLKWPNDLLLGGKKVGGILCEAPALGGARNDIVVGLGVNTGRCDFPPELAATATCLGGADPLPVIAAWVSNLESWVEGIGRGELAAIVEAWRRRAEPFGRRVRCGRVEGTTVDLDRAGRLLLAIETGGVVALGGGIVEEMP